MKFHLFFILMLILIVPILTISLIWNSLIKNENDAIQYRFETVLEERLQKLNDQNLDIISQTEQELITIDKYERPDLINTVIFFTSAGRLSPNYITPTNTRPDDLLFAHEILERAFNKTKPPKTDRLSRIVGNNFEYASSEEHGWVQKLDSSELDLWYWHFIDEDTLKIMDVKISYLLNKISGLELPQDIGANDSVVMANSKAELIHLWGTEKPLANMATPKASVTMPFPLNTMRLYYFTDNFPSIDMEFRILILSVAGSLLLLGGYFFWEHMRNIDDTMQKVSFVNQVSHELKTPLTNIRMYVDLLKTNLEDDSESMKKLEIVDHEAVRLSRLINNVLTFSNQKNIQISPVACDTDQVVTTLLESFKPQLQKQGFEIRLNCQAGTYKLDKELFEQILVNLISNAQKYAASGQYLNIHTFIEGNRFHLKVADKGPGIPEHLQERVFKPFIRGDNKATEGVSGTGLGLFLVKELTERQNGQLILESNENGTTFEIIL